MLPSYQHVGNMLGHGTKPLRRAWVPDLSGTLIAVLVLAGVLALEHFHFQSRLARVSTLEVSLAKQLNDLQTTLQQQTDQLHRMNPKLDEIDTAEDQLKLLQDEVTKSKMGLVDVKTTLEALQRANATGALSEVVQQQSRDIWALTLQLVSLQQAQSAGNVTAALVDGRLEQLETNTSKLADKLDFHNSALKTLADQLASHQNSTISALQQQTAVVSEVLDRIKVGAAAGAGGVSTVPGPVGVPTPATTGDVSTAVETAQAGVAAAPAPSTGPSNSTATSSDASGAGAEVPAVTAPVNASPYVNITEVTPTVIADYNSSAAAAVTGGGSAASAAGASPVITANTTGTADTTAAVAGVSPSAASGDAATASVGAGDDHLIREHASLAFEDGDDSSGLQAGSAQSTDVVSREYGGADASTAGANDANTTITTIRAGIVEEITVVEAGASSTDGAAQAGAGQVEEADGGEAQKTPGAINSKAALDALHALVSSSTDDQDEAADGGDSSAAFGEGADRADAASSSTAAGASRRQGLAGAHAADSARHARDMARFTQHLKQGTHVKGRFDRMQHEFDKQRQLHGGGAAQAGAADAATSATSTEAEGAAEAAGDTTATQTDGVAVLAAADDAGALVDEEDQDQI